MSLKSKIAGILEKPERLGLWMTGFLLTIVAVNNLISLKGQLNDDEVSGVSILVQFLIGTYLLLNTIVNLTRAAQTDASINSIPVQIKQLPEWRYCSFCEQYAPPRSFHCYTCRRCILKRHNHCLFMGKCVGHNNHRFYILFIWYVWLGSVFSTYLNWHHFVLTYQNFSLKVLMINMMPMFAWVFGFISALELYSVFTNTMCLVLSMLVFVYFLINFRMTLRNQTWHESAKNIQVYDLGGWKNNLREAMGVNWLVCVFNPFAQLKLTSDGTQFRQNDQSAATSSSFDNNQQTYYSSDTGFPIPKRRVV